MIEDIKRAAIRVYNFMGPGHSETVYETAMAVELDYYALTHRQQVPCILSYRGFAVGTGFIDILINEKMVVEIKAVAKLSGKEDQQVRKYLTAMNLEDGVLINFGNDLEIVEVQKGHHGDTSSEAS